MSFINIYNINVRYDIKLFFSFSAEHIMPMIPLGLKETKDIDFQDPFKVSPDSTRRPVFRIIVFMIFHSSNSPLSPFTREVVRLDCLQNFRGSFLPSRDPSHPFELVWLPSENREDPKVGQSRGELAEMSRAAEL